MRLVGGHQTFDKGSLSSGGGLTKSVLRSKQEPHATCLPIAVGHAEGVPKHVLWMLEIILLEVVGLDRACVENILGDRNIVVFAGDP